MCIIFICVRKPFDTRGDESAQSEERKVDTNNSYVGFELVDTVMNSDKQIGVIDVYREVNTNVLYLICKTDSRYVGNSYMTVLMKADGTAMTYDEYLEFADEKEVGNGK